MEARLFFLCVICQTSITVSLGGVTSEYPDLVGKVTPIKPKPLTPSTVTSSSPLICNTKDIMPKVSSASGGVFREFTSPLTFTTSSRALPVPKIDSISIEDVKLPERLREKFLTSKLFDAAFRKTKLDISLPEGSSPYKYSVLSFPSKLPKASPAISSPDMCPNSLNKLSSLSNIKSLPLVPVEALKGNTVPSTSNWPLTLEARLPLLPEQLTTNALCPPSSSCLLPYPLYYESMYLPGVRTPTDVVPFNCKPTSKTENRNLNFPNQFYHQNLVNLPSDRNTLSSFPYLNPINPSEISKSQNMIQVPKTSWNVPFSAKPASSAQNGAIQNPWSLLRSSPGCTSVPCKSRFEPHESLLSSTYLRNDKNLKSLLSSLSCTLVDKISDFTQMPPKISSEVLASMPLKDFSRKFNVPSMFPVKDSYEKTIESKHSNDPRITFHSFPSLRQVTTSNQCSLLSDKCIAKTLKYSPPTIPREPIPTISSVSSSFSPITYCPSRTSQTPITSYISHTNQSPSSSIAHSTSKIVSSINNFVSNIAQDILSSYKSHINSAPQDVLQKPRYTPKSNPYAEAVFKPEQTPSVISTLPQVDQVTTQSISPIITSIDTNPPAVVTALEISSSQPSAAPVLPVITFSSPQLCPSYLPSPVLPSYPSIASPLYMEAPVFKVKSSKKDSDVETLIELMLLAEILNNDESFDWDDLDTLLAFLSLS